MSTPKPDQTNSDTTNPDTTGSDTTGPSSAQEETRPAKPGNTDTTRFGMEDGDNTDVPATGLDPEQQTPGR